MTYRSKPPYRIVGSKWQWAAIFEDASEDFNRYDVIIDAFGGSCWVTHWLEHHTSKPRLIVNDYDHYLDAVTQQSNIDFLNQTLSKILAIYASCSFTQEEMSILYEGRKYPRIGLDKHGVWHHRVQFDEIKRIIADLPTRAMRSLIYSRFWVGGAPSPNTLNYPTPGYSKPFQLVEDYLTRAEVIHSDAFDIDVSQYHGKVLLIADPPFSAVQHADQYYCGEWSSNNMRGTLADSVYAAFSGMCDMLIFSDLEQLADLLPEPDEIWIRETNNIPYGNTRRNHAAATRVQAAYLYKE